LAEKETVKEKESVAKKEQGEENIGTVISSLEGPSPGSLDFVANKGKVHRGQFVEMDFDSGTLIALVNDVQKTNRYFERADSVKEFERNGSAMFEQFPTAEWEYLVAKTRPLGVFSEAGIKRVTFPPSPGTRIRLASKENLERFLNFDKNGLLLGEVDHHNLPVKLGMSSLLKKHVCFLAQSGGGKSYAVSVLLEELLDRPKESGRIATIVLDPHGEYSCFATPPSEKGKKDYSSKTRLVKASDIKIGVPKLSVGVISGILPGLSAPQKRDLGRILNELKAQMKEGLGPFDLNDLKDSVARDEAIKENSKAPLLGWLDMLRELRLFGKTDNPSIPDLIKPGKLTVIDLSDTINLKKKQVIVSYFAQRIFNERRNNRVPPFLMVLEEAHQFVPQMAKSETAISRSIIRTIAREGRKFGASLCLVSQRPVQLDTTALSQCVSPDTEVLLADGQQKSIRHLKNSWNESEVLTCNILDGTIEKSAISAYLKTSPSFDKKKCFRVLSESGRELSCTSNHPIWVKDRGWVNAGDLQKGDFVAVLPTENDFSKEAHELKISWNAISSILPSTINKKKLFNELKSQKFICQNIERKKVLALVRLIGHIFGDGTLHPPYKNSDNQHLLRITFSGCESDLLEVKKDLQLLGFNTAQKICRQEKTSYSNFINFGRRKIKGTSTSFKTGIVALWAILRILKAPLGCKTDHKVSIPLWIKNADKEVKREFLSALCGSECSTVRWNNGRFPEKLILPFSKISNLVQNGDIFASQLMGLFEEFGVKTSLYKRDYVIRKDGTKTIQFIISIQRNRNNLINFFGNINYRYSVKRSQAGLYSLECLKWLNFKTSEKICFWKKINGLSVDRSPKEISIAYNLNQKVVKNWLSMTATKVRLAPSDNIPSFHKWLAERTEGLSGGLIWDKVNTLEQVELKDVRDITIPKYNCFFANSFLTHNCNTHIILRITNPYDLKHIGESSEGLDSKSVDMITSLRVGEALLVGEATHYPLFFKVRKRKSAESKHEKSLERAGLEFEQGLEEKDAETAELL